MLEFGRHVTSHNEAVVVIESAVYMFVPLQTLNGSKPNDGRFAIGIKGGLIQMCLRLLSRFGEKQDDKIFDSVYNILQFVCQVALEKKSSLALVSQRDEIVEVVSVLAREAQGRSEKLKDVLHSVEMILDMTNTTSTLGKGERSCHCCSKMMSKKDIRRCGACNQAIYCSKDCQVQHWHSTHKRDCKHLQLTGQIDGFGSTAKDKVKIEKKMRSIVENAVNASRVIFSKNVPGILMQAILYDCDVLDGCIFVHHADCPPSIRWVPMLECKDLVEGDDEGSEHRTRRVEEIRDSGSIPCFTIYPVKDKTICASQPGFCGDKLPLGVGISEFSPAVGFTSWSLHQNEMKQFYSGMMDEIKRNPKVREQMFGKQFCVWYQNVFMKRELKAPIDMTIKELKAEIASVGLTRKTIGFAEKAEFVDLLQKHRDGNL